MKGEFGPTRADRHLRARDGTLTEKAMDVSFPETLGALEAELAKETPEIEALVQCLRALRKGWPDDPTPDDVRRSFAVSTAVLALGPSGTPPGRLSHAVMEMIRRMVVDPSGWHRVHVQRSFDHHTAFGRKMPGDRFDEPVPVAALPVTASEARGLIQPLLTSYEDSMDAQPMRHFNLAWEVLMHPAAPFDRVFAAWLKEVEARGLGLGDSYSALRRSMAFWGLADRGRQRVSRKGVDEIFLPVLDDPNPMLAAAAARFLGRVHAEPEEFYNHGTPWPLPDLLTYLANRPLATRRAVAGGFLNGFADCDEPFQLLREDARLAGFDLDGWVIALLADTPEEVLIPSAQAFWFYIHEGFAVNADFVARLMDEGHDWIAMMCATELRSVVDGMEPVLRRLAASSDREAAAGAARHLSTVYAAR